VSSSQAQGDAAFWRRSDFYLRFLPFARLLYGLEQRRESDIQQARADLCALFGA